MGAASFPLGLAPCDYHPSWHTATVARFGLFSVLDSEKKVTSECCHHTPANLTGDLDGGDIVVT